MTRAKDMLYAPLAVGPVGCTADNNEAGIERRQGTIRKRDGGARASADEPRAPALLSRHPPVDPTAKGLQQ